MGDTARQSVPSVKATGNIRRCLACGEALRPRNRRYCSLACQQDLLASLNRRTGLLQTLNTRYATFYFTEFVIMMDLLLYNSDQIFSYLLARSPGRKPVEDFRQLSNRLGTLWWNERDRTNKRYLATWEVLEQARRRDAPVGTVKPVAFSTPAVRSGSLVALDIRADELIPAKLGPRIKRAYRRQVKKHHPDMGGSQEMFLKIQEAYETLIHWARHPTFISHRGFPDKWLYQGACNCWIRPIPAKRKRR
jgi:hypothetical protein